MRRLIENDINIKIISVLFAVLLWIYVINFNNPIDTKVISVSLRYVNEDALKQKGISLRSRDYQDVVVTVKGRKLQLRNIDESSFQPAILDLAQINTVEDSLIQIKEPQFIGKENIKVLSVAPQVKKLDLEKIGKNSVKVQVIREGSLKDNYKVIDVNTVPEVISIQGYDSIVSLVTSLKCNVRYENLDRDMTFKHVPVKAVNKEGAEVLGVTGDLYVDVTVKVAKEVAVIPTVKGTPAVNFMDGTHITSPNRVLITGEPELISNIDWLGTDTINIDNADKSFNINKNIILPKGVKLYNASRDVKVSIDIEPLAERVFVLKNEDIAFMNTEIDNSLNYSVLTPKLEIRIKGEREYLEKLTLASIKPSVDVAGLGKGTHTLPLKVTLSGISKLEQQYIVEVSIEKREAEPVSTTKQD